MTYIDRLPPGSTRPEPVAVVVDFLAGCGANAELREQVRAAALAVYGPTVMRDAERVFSGRPPLRVRR